MESAGPESAYTSPFSQTFVHRYSYRINPCCQVLWAILHRRGSNGVYTHCWGQPGTRCMDLVSSAALRHQSANTDLHVWACSTSRYTTDRQVVDWALGTLFPSRADQANMPFIRTFPLWLEASGCCCNTYGQNTEAHTLASDINTGSDMIILSC